MSSVTAVMSSLSRILSSPDFRSAFNALPSPPIATPSTHPPQDPRHSKRTQSHFWTLRLGLGTGIPTPRTRPFSDSPYRRSSFIGGQYLFVILTHYPSTLCVARRIAWPSNPSIRHPSPPCLQARYAKRPQSRYRTLRHPPNPRSLCPTAHRLTTKCPPPLAPHHSAPLLPAAILV